MSGLKSFLKKLWTNSESKKTEEVIGVEEAKALQEAMNRVEIMGRKLSQGGSTSKSKKVADKRMEEPVIIQEIDRKTKNREKGEEIKDGGRE